MRKITVAMAGNPNSGKTTIFNNLTGSHQHVGNYPGVTVEKKSGTLFHKEHEIEITDLPGTYGLTAFALDEKVARDFILTERPDVVVNVIDTSNIERNLYLTTQLMELQVPLVLVFNMSDIARIRGMAFDIQLLEKYFGGPIVEAVGHKNRGTKDILDAVLAVAREGYTIPASKLKYGRDIEETITALEPLIREDLPLMNAFTSIPDSANRVRWLTVKLLEQDPDVENAVSLDALKDSAAQAIAAMEKIFRDAPSVVIADRRYGYISGACQEAVRNTVEFRHTLSDKVDAVVTHRLFGLPIFLAAMYMVFTLTFKLGDPLMTLMENAFSGLSALIFRWWPGDTWMPLRSLLVDGVIRGVGGVIVFLPNILLLFLAIAILEYSGYMARAAFVVDRLMHKIGLHGKSFIPMLIGFGCSVPAIMATRTLDSQRNRLITMLVIPLMSCGARLTIYALIIPAFFPKHLYGPMLFLIYLIGIVLAIAGARLLGLTILKEETPGFVMELPPYRLPTWKAIGLQMWERSWLYLHKAGTIILGVSIIMWIITSFPKHTNPAGDLSVEEARSEQLAHSIAGRIGHAIEPVLRPMGFDWKIGTALIGAFAAKEVFVSQMAIIYSVGDDAEDRDSLRQVLRENYTPLVGFCILLFSLIGFPCAATIAAVRMESGRWKWAWFQLISLTLLAYVLTTLVYQIGSRLFSL